LEKHQVSIEEAQKVFYDELAVQFFDVEHFYNEAQFLLLAMAKIATSLGLILVIAACASGPRPHWSSCDAQAKAAGFQMSDLYAGGASNQDYGQGNRIYGKGNIVQGHDNCIVGNDNKISGSQNSVIGSGNSM
jgi:hypothetical protein